MGAAIAPIIAPVSTPAILPIGDKIIIDTGLVVKRTAETSYTLYAFSEKIVYNDYAGLYLPEDLSLAIERINRESLGEVSLIDF